MAAAGRLRLQYDRDAGFGGSSCNFPSKGTFGKRRHFDAFCGELECRVNGLVPSYNKLHHPTSSFCTETGIPVDWSTPQDLGNQELESNPLC